MILFECPVETAQVVKSALLCNFRDRTICAFQKRCSIFIAQTVDIVTEADHQPMCEDIGDITAADEKVLCDAFQADILREMIGAVGDDLCGLTCFFAPRTKSDLFGDEMKYEVDQRLLHLVTFGDKILFETLEYIGDLIVVIAPITYGTRGDLMRFDFLTLHDHVRIEDHNGVYTAFFTVLVRVNLIGKGDEKHPFFHGVFFTHCKCGKTAAEHEDKFYTFVEMRRKVDILQKSQF